MSDKAQAGGLLPVAEAQARVMALARPPRPELCPLRHAAGRRMLVAARAGRDQPPFDASAMDGYAVSALPAVGERLQVVGQAGAGHGWQGKLVPGQALRIFTGAPVPPGGTHVLLQEDVTQDGGWIRVNALPSGTNIRAQGQDFPAEMALSPRLLRPADLALLAAMDVPQVTVAARPVVALIQTGDELVPPGEPARPDQIMASNGVGLAALVEEAGAIARLLPIARDTVPALEQVFAMARDADVIVTIGGASVGDHDLVGRVAQDLGLEAAVWKVALRPGKPLMAGRMGDAVFLGLPGNPVSAFVCATLFLIPLIRALQGDPAPLPVPQMGRTTCDLAANGPRTHYMRASLSEGGQAITPFAAQDSALLGVLSQADALLIRPPHAPAAPAGTKVEWLPL